MGNPKTLRPRSFDTNTKTKHIQNQMQNYQEGASNNLLQCGFLLQLVCAISQIDKIRYHQEKQLSIC
jgi:hypothetical protein